MDSLFPPSPLSGLKLARQQSIYYEAMQGLEEEVILESQALKEDAMLESKALEKDAMMESEALEEPKSLKEALEEPKALEEPMATSGPVCRVLAAAFVLSNN